LNVEWGRKEEEKMKKGGMRHMSEWGMRKK
jgi:hypothetical protein